MNKWMLSVKTGAGLRDIYIFADTQENAKRLFEKQWGVAFNHHYELLSIEAVEND